TRRPRSHHSYTLICEEPEYTDWFNHRRLHVEIGMVPPVELEDTYHHNHPAPAPADAALASL
ncbi:hypothetical protein, partial [Rothia kristinae]|uniref:hypothetical protein n=1 Tax=Rothia kristinae TaxID=37923 RepID=UPI0022DFD397